MDGQQISCLATSAPRGLESEQEHSIAVEGPMLFRFDGGRPPPDSRARHVTWGTSASSSGEPSGSTSPA
ncbi:hypothetical protein MAPG_05988 [Magnaporthiopsis poae ATCC 64411]|uniref:Uncharacterized protein n=1 Tax=Magnaporthiopsis poae (strain ATCC 64411 / 73-15) TaxID=644358 RepID=A0A0C4E0V1_MAGP6|nr:hypothetical protein MAPG_05988 [Magnaporthiopsis poae ATCC 64411]